jgi:hypothetical protein
MPRKQASSPESYKTVSDSDGSDFAPSPPAKRAKIASRRIVTTKTKVAVGGNVPDIEDAGSYIVRPHEMAYHSTSEVVKLQRELLEWFESTRYVWDSDAANEEGQARYALAQAV